MKKGHWAGLKCTLDVTCAFHANFLSWRKELQVAIQIFNAYINVTNNYLETKMLPQAQVIKCMGL